LVTQKKKNRVWRPREKEREEERGSLETRLMDSRLHQSDKRDSRALIRLSPSFSPTLSLLPALILLLFYLISETRTEKRRRAVRR